MPRYKKPLRGKKKVFGSTTVSGGLEVLTKLTSPTLSISGQLEKYRKSLYVFACINKIAQKVAVTQFQLFKILNSTGDTKEITTHPALDLIYKPNPFQTKTEFLETTIINLKCTGEAFWFKVRNNSGRVIELWNLRPDCITVVSDPAKFIKSYKFNKDDGTTVEFDPEEIIFFKYPDSTTAYRGLSPIHAASRRVQTEEYATRWQSDFFLNSARPDGLIKNKDSTLTKDQKTDIRENWNKRHGGLNNSYKVAILEGGLEYQLISLSQREMDYIESLKFTRDDILVAFAVPKPIIAIVDDVNRANSETAMTIFLGETIEPEVRRLEEKINEQLIYPDFGEEFYIGHIDQTPANQDQKLKAYSDGIQYNYLLINEVRAREGLPPLRGGWSFYMPLTSMAVGGLSAADQKSLAKAVIENSDINEEILKKEETKKTYDFKGRFWLKKKLEIHESAKAALSGVLDNEKKRKKTKKFVSLIKDPELRDQFAVMVNKKIDQYAEKLKPAVDDFFNGQMHRVIAELAKKNGKTERMKLNAEQILNYDKEIGLSIKFITPYIETFLKEAGLEALNMIAPQVDFQDTGRIQKLIQERAQFFAETVNSTTLQKLDSTLAEGIGAAEGIRDLTTRVEDVYSEFPTYRSEMIARTEATAANAEGTLEGYRQSDVVTGKEWINSADSRVRDEHQDGIGVGGEIVPVDENFSNGMPYPCEPNCRCVLGPAFIE